MNYVSEIGNSGNTFVNIHGYSHLVGLGICQLYAYAMVLRMNVVKLRKKEFSEQDMISKKRRET